jgi:4-hydroxybenzoate polyprenyltransferase
MTLRLYRFTMRAYPPALYLPFTFGLAAGLTGLFVVASGPAQRWPQVAGVLITATTVFVDMLLLRALDDIRDLEYDRAHAPGRPLPSGVVSVRDLTALVTACCAALLLLNADRGQALAVLAAQLAYAIGLITANVRLGWLCGENLLVQLALNLPIQILLSLYVYAAFLQTGQLTLRPAGLLAVAAVVLSVAHCEFARKTTRSPAAAERTYVRHLGLGGTLAVTAATALLTVALASLVIRPWSVSSPGYYWGWLALVPLVVPAVAGWKFVRHRLPRWPVLGALSFPLCAYAVFLAVGLLGGLR